MGEKPANVRQEDWDEANNAEKEPKRDFASLKSRWCTDCPCCLVFVVFLLSLILLGFVGFTEGDTTKLATPFDYNGRQCGQPDQLGTDLTAYPYKFITGVFSSNAIDGGEVSLNPYDAVCVENCDTPVGGVLPCASLNGEECPYNGIVTQVYMNSMCLPAMEEGSELLIRVFKDLSQQPGSQKYVSDIINSWQTLVIMLFATIVITIGYIIALRFFVKPLLFFSMTAVFLIFVGGGFYFWQQSNEYVLTPDDPNYENGSWQQQVQYAQIGAGVLWGLAFAFMCCVLCCWKSIMLGAALMQASSEFVSSNVRIVLTPLLAYFFAVIFMAWWCISATWLYSMGEVVPASNPNLSLMANIDLDDQAFYTMWYYLFGLFWVVAFLMCLQKFIIAAAATLWYFDPIDDGSKDVSVMEAMSWGLWYHCGTIAMGSFIIAVVQLLRAIFEYMVQQSQGIDDENPVKKAVICIVRCYLWCLDKCVKYISENAFIACCVHNQSFCPAAWNSFTLTIRHVGHFSSLAMVDTMLSVLGQGFICASSAILAYFIADRGYPLIQQPAIPALAIIAYAYVVASLFLSIFSFSARTILFCYLFDEDNGGSVDTPAVLQPFIDKLEEQKATQDNQIKPHEGGNKMA